MDDNGTETDHALIFVQYLVVLAQRDQEDQSGDVLETVIPLLTPGPLTTDIELFVSQFAGLESCLGDTSRLERLRRISWLVGV